MGLKTPEYVFLHGHRPNNEQAKRKCRICLAGDPSTEWVSSYTLGEAQIAKQETIRMLREENKAFREKQKLLLGPSRWEKQKIREAIRTRRLDSLEDIVDLG